ncbi:MAG: hypothetical protein JSV83_12765 [Desulfobacterales bacterium]|nr:MAG: hypothetical protein JSV83_12765 [Desulfobacterales bacterium]
MKEKIEPTKIVKGGFRATLALIFSIIALIFSVITFNRTTSQTEYQTEIKELKEKMEKMKQETAERVNKIRQETANAVKRMGIEIKKQTETPESSENQ